jgi:hypothetical protein
MNAAPTESALVAAPKTPETRWSRQRWIFWITFAFATHVALIFIFGTNKRIAPRAVNDVPHFRLADQNSALIALGNPALFALPNEHDFASAVWLKIPKLTPPSFHYDERPGWLPLTFENLGAGFSKFMQTNRSAPLQLDYKPEPPLAQPVVALESALPTNSTLVMVGELAQRRRLNQIVLPSLPLNNVIEPSRVQVLVTAAGDVFSAVLLPSGNPLDHNADADQRALTLALTLRFAPAADSMLGELIFQWHTLPVATTNAP